MNEIYFIHKGMSTITLDFPSTFVRELVSAGLNAFTSILYNLNEINLRPTYPIFTANTSSQ